MFEGTKVQVDKLENGYGIKTGSDQEGNVRKHVFTDFWGMVENLRRQFGVDVPCSIPTAVPIELYRDKEAQLDAAMRELAGWRQIHDNAPLERVQQLKQQAQDFTRSIREHIAHNQGEEAAKRSEQARKAAQVRHKKPAPRKR